MTVVPAPAKWTWLAVQPLAQPVSPHLVDPAQLSLFEAHRDWSCLTAGALDQMSSLTPAAEALTAEFQQHARARGWNASPRNTGAKTLRILLAWAGADAPIHEADIRALSQRRSTAIRRVLQFLQERGMVTPDPARQGTAVERAVRQRIQTLPDGMAGELRRWVGPGPRNLPAHDAAPARPDPTDKLRGLIDRAETPMAKLTVALIAIHGLGKKETSQLLLADLELSRGRITVRRPAQPGT